MLLTLLVTAVLWVTSGAPAHAQPSVNEIATALRVDPVLNDPLAENALTPGQATELRAQVATAGQPIYVAVLPASALNQTAGDPITPDELLSSIEASVGGGGTFALVVGDSFRAGSSLQSVTAAANEAFASQSSNGPYAVLSTFVAAVSDQPADTPSSGMGIVVLVLLAIGIVIALVLLRARRSRRRLEQRRLAQVGATLTEDITEFGERLGQFNQADDRLSDSSRQDLAVALDAYSTASATSAALQSEADVVRTTRALDDGRYALARAAAQMSGHEPPARRPPCFFDPRHGVSFADVSWHGGRVSAPAHAVPACAECATIISAGGEPPARQVEVDGQIRPYWNAGPAYAPYARGYFDNVAGLLPAIFMGTMLAQAFTMPAAMASTGMAAGMDGGGFGGGDFGGGDFGGGGFGSGGFGGGDFGGM